MRQFKQVQTYAFYKEDIRKITVGSCLEATPKFDISGTLQTSSKESAVTNNHCALLAVTDVSSSSDKSHCYPNYGYNSITSFFWSLLLQYSLCFKFSNANPSNKNCMIKSAYQDQTAVRSSLIWVYPLCNSTN